MMLEYALLGEILAAERARDLMRTDVHRAEALEMAPPPPGLRATVASTLVRLATALDANAARPAAAG
jgi:hypothetical protein